MNTRVSSLAAAFALSLGCGAVSSVMAQPAPGQASIEASSPSIAASAVGRWLYDAQGQIIGSVRRISDDGRVVTIIVGSYNQPGIYEARVPASALFIVNGRVTLRTETIDALSTRFGRG